MITKNDLIVGQYVKCIYGSYVEIIESVNSQYAYTNLKNRIYPKDYNEYFVLTEEEAKAHYVRNLNEEIQSLLLNLQNFKKEVYNLSNLPYLTIDTEELEEDLEDIIIRTKEVLEEVEQDEQH